MINVVIPSREDGEEPPAGVRRSPGDRPSCLLVHKQPRSSCTVRPSLGRGGFLAVFAARNDTSFATLKIAVPSPATAGEGGRRPGEGRPPS